MELSVLPQRLAVCRLEADDAVPGWAGRSGLWSVTRTPDELSVVCDERDVPDGVRHEGGWRALKLHGPFAFSEVGVLAPIAVALARAEVPILALATFETDYVLVPEERLETARLALVAAGYGVIDA